MTDIKTVTLRCSDGAEACVFTKYTFKTLVHRIEHTDSIEEDISYEINIQDDYTGGDYKGFFGRIKRAWRAFWDKPVVYTGIYCEDKEQIQKFLEDCLVLIKEDGESFEIECESQSVIDETIKEAFAVIREAMLREKE